MIEWAGWLSWGVCSSTCGTGSVTRIKECIAGNGGVVPNSECEGSVPQDSGTCVEQICPGN